MSANDLPIFKTAILNEAEGEHFYQLAAEKANDHDVKNAFLFLAEEERQHGIWLREMMQCLAPGQTFDLKQLESKEGAELSPHIFSLSKAPGKQNTLEISVFHIGILMEKASLDFYREAAQSTDNADAKKLFETLATWEMHHLDELEKAYDLLTVDWFDHQGFSPA
jgi:rubrerythrin